MMANNFFKKFLQWSWHLFSQPYDPRLVPWEWNADFFNVFKHQATTFFDDNDA